jgi:flagellar motility protein MotE (MotC chaperone)
MKAVIYGIALTFAYFVFFHNNDRNKDFVKNIIPSNISSNFKTKNAAPNNVAIPQPIPNADTSVEKSDKQITDEFKRFLNSTPQNIQKEIAIFRQAIRSLQEEAQSSYDHLSTEAKDFLETQRNYENQLSPSARETLKKEFMFDQ